MKTKINIIISLILTLFISSTAIAQKSDKVNFSAARLKSEVQGSNKYRVFLSSPQKRVIITKSGSTVYCDKAKENIKTKFITATGNVIVVEDKTKITGDKMTYDRFKGEIIITGRRVVMNDGEVELVTDKLYYYTETKDAKYLTGGTVTKETMVLTSKKGYMKEKTLDFEGDVVIDDPAKDQHLESEAVTYHRDTEMAEFNVETVITTKDGDVIAQAGTYNTKTGKVNLEGNTIVENEQYLLLGDKVDTQKDSGNSIARGNVVSYSKSDSVTIYADEIIHEKGKTKAYGKALMSRPMNGDFNDMFYLSADTLYSVHDSVAKETTLYAYHNVKVFSKDMKAKCDSLVYFYNDSMIYFYEDPVIWAMNNQMIGRSIRAQITSKGIDKLYLDKNAFIISQDSTDAGNDNQLKGKKIIAYFKDSFLDKIDINGNGQSIFYVTDEETGKITGMNVVKCPSMTMLFDARGDLEDINYNTKSESDFLKPSSINKLNSRLPGYKLRVDERPPISDMIERLRSRENPPSNLPIDPHLKKKQ